MPTKRVRMMVATTDDSHHHIAPPNHCHEQLLTGWKQRMMRAVRI
jgi:hypothetical protein